MKIAIAGTGYAVSHLIDRLLARGDEVVGVDNLFKGARVEPVTLSFLKRGVAEFETLKREIEFPKSELVSPASQGRQNH